MQPGQELAHTVPTMALSQLSLAATMCPGPLREGGGGVLARGPQTFKGPHEAFIFMIFTIMSCIFTLFLCLSLCLNSMSERLGRILSNDFTVSVEKL